MTEPLDTVPVVILFGPTASGKTAVLEELFTGTAPFRAEIVSADSMQVYRGMDIGTAKPTPAERAALPHHLIDIRSPREQFNAGDFVRLASAACRNIHRRGLVPVVSGGTGFYLKTLMYGLPEAPPSDPVLRARLREELKNRGAGALAEELAAFDPVSARRIHINDEYRLLRALEVLRLTGRPLSSYARNGAPAEAAPGALSGVRNGVPDAAGPGGMEGECPFRFLLLALDCGREQLYKRINERCAKMFRQGLPGEVETLFRLGYTPLDPGLKAIGYREFFVEDEPGTFRVSQDREAVQELIARNSRRYAKRQICYFASIPGVRRIEAGSSAAGEIARALENFLRL
ncbi:MAG: tRNA (adenosine(37)-N6)-dimethylallyltransferase MiaA [Treponema sp.]|jgi:tRNA dimethylallyltransferase|nr:tRNA (adenosine(37)-N6)-dimethylallyltransferase MiaA [Treponema sp.]